MMTHRVRCFFDVEVDGIPSGRVIFELFSDVCPKTCENFRALCTGEMGNGKETDKPLHYRGVKFHRVIKDFMIQGGDFSAGNGTGGESIYGGQFEDESFDINHEEPFLLSMANRGKDTNGSQFFITTQPSPHLDGKHVVFGRVVSGKEVVAAIEDLPVDNRSRPLQPAVISNCGELILQRPVKNKEKKHKKKKVSSSDADSEVEKKKKKKKKEKKQKKHKKAKSSDEEGEVKEDEEATNGAVINTLRPHPFATVSVINPDEIPDIPKNRFLYRAGPEKDNDQMRAGRARERDRIRAYTKSGRKVKGRGSLRYRTPSRSRSRSRSVTPPHWRQAQRRTISYDQLQKRNDEKQRREEDRMAREQEREQEIEERKRRREERHREQEGKNFDADGRHQGRGGYFARRGGNWMNSRDRNRDQDRRGEDGWRGTGDRRGFRGDRRYSRNSDDDDEGYDAREQIQHQKGKFIKGESVESDEKIKREDEKMEASIADDQPSDGTDFQKEDTIKKEKQEVLDENALDYEAMDNDDEEEEEEADKGISQTNGKTEENDIGNKSSPTPDIEGKEVKKDDTDKKGSKDEKRSTSDHREKRSRSRGKERERSRDRRDRSRDRRNRSRDRRRSRDRGSHRDRSRNRGSQRDRSRERSRDRRNRSRDRRPRSRDRRGRSRDRRGRSRDRRERSRDRKSRSRDRSKRSQERRSRSRDKSRDRRSKSKDRSRERKSRSRDRSRDRRSSSRDRTRRGRGSSSSSSSDSD